MIKARAAWFLQPVVVRQYHTIIWCVSGNATEMQRSAFRPDFIGQRRRPLWEKVNSLHPCNDKSSKAVPILRRNKRSPLYRGKDKWAGRTFSATVSPSLSRICFFGCRRVVGHPFFISAPARTAVVLKTRQYLPSSISLCLTLPIIWNFVKSLSSGVPVLKDLCSCLFRISPHIGYPYFRLDTTRLFCNSASHRRKNVIYFP